MEYKAFLLFKRLEPTLYAGLNQKETVVFINLSAAIDGRKENVYICQVL